MQTYLFLKQGQLELEYIYSSLCRSLSLSPLFGMHTNTLIKIDIQWKRRYIEFFFRLPTTYPREQMRVVAIVTTPTHYFFFILHSEQERLLYT